MKESMSPRLAVLGFGLLGSEIAVRLRSQGFRVAGWNRTLSKAQALTGQGIDAADSPAAAIADAEVILLLLSDAEAIEATLFSSNPAPDFSTKILVQMGTIAPDESRRLARRVADQGGAYLEAPVLGSLPEARAGNLILMAGGDAALFERCNPVFQALSQQPQRIGELGQAAGMKLAMNQLIAGLTATFSLSLGLVRQEGNDVDQFMSLLRGSALYAPTFDKKLSNYLSQDYAQANFPLRHLLKDIALFHRVVESSGMDTAALTALESACKRGLAAGLGDADYSALYSTLVEANDQPSG
ncbi:NAD(P)-dependent oxidoreductase [Thiorhodovibrio frisius]|uniref:Beta-hydroxyacid dehydrogenase, 3-hydroxyisobutyrate dehydrogenase n=1 Tax=Thiorhodovibrio frisius TaxID=631362 RepID=H8Z7F2_9GAMM|nr:NAD(P)-dependent oxidoreductase [Thiorhodovibrio frisius]EIC20882.1 beta-hydroxyacid dehydrogenase, 3-hydroxyisobutyrate dehydrogenase [Thiorhodovibrio frisius]WPL21937.1 2-hydroxy-3-oxopropionate reductase [Thiorhodovibrio frisius]